MCCSDPPEAPEPINPAGQIGLDFLLGNAAFEGPYSRTALYRDGQEISQADIARAIAEAFRDPRNPNIGALSGLLSAERRTVEDPRVRAMRERQQETENLRRAIGMQYMGQFGTIAPGLPASQFGLPAGGAAAQPGFDPSVPGGVPSGAGMMGAGIPMLPQQTGARAIPRFDPYAYAGFFGAQRRPEPSPRITPTKDQP